MGWLDNLRRRRQGRTRDSAEETARAQEAQKPKADEDVADELEEEAFQERNEEIYRVPRIPPGTG